MKEDKKVKKASQKASRKASKQARNSGLNSARHFSEYIREKWTLLNNTIDKNVVLGTFN